MHSTEATAAPWFSALPLSDPRCDNDSCVAYETAHKASQAHVTWASQFAYGHYTAWIFAAVIFLLALAHGYVRLVAPRAREHRTVAVTRAAWRYVAYRRVRGAVARYLGLPSFGVLLLMGFSTLAALLLAFTQHPYYRQRRGYGSPPLGVRTGLMAYSLMPLELALAGKFNIITMLTGLGHEKLNAMHRFVGWMILVLSIIHTVPFIYQPLAEGGANMLRQQFYGSGSQEYTGIPCFAMLFGLVLFSLPPFRRMAYRFFVAFHWLFAVVFLGLCFWHAANALDSWTYLWATLAIWLVSILGRLFFKSSLLPLRGVWLTGCRTSTHTLPHDMIRVDVHTNGRRFRFEPGQHVYLRRNDAKLIDAHPFTVFTSNTQSLGTLSFLIRCGKNGRFGKAGLGNVTLDGPYGSVLRPAPEIAADTVILVAGGGGISGVLPWLQHLATRLEHPTQACTLKHLTLYWSVKHDMSFAWVESELNAIRARVSVSQGLTLEAFVTQQPDETTLEKSLVKTESEIFSRIHRAGRMHITDIVEQSISPGRTMFIGCGPESMKIDLCNAVANAQRQVLAGKAESIRLHTETFGW